MFQPFNILPWNKFHVYFIHQQSKFNHRTHYWANVSHQQIPPKIVMKNASSRLLILWATQWKNGKLLDPSVLELYRRQFTRTIIVNQKQTKFPVRKLKTLHCNCSSESMMSFRVSTRLHIYTVHITVNQSVSVCAEF